MKKVLFLLVFLPFYFSCSNQKSIELEQEPLISDLFSEHEISSLHLIVNYFDDFIKNETGEKQINEAYTEFVKRLSLSNSNEELIKKANLNSDSIVILINQLKANNFFDEIWLYEYGMDYRTKDTLSISLAPNTEGKYFQFLRKFPQDNEYLKHYTNTMEECACISPNLVLSFQNAYSEFDFTREVNRLIGAVHYMTIASEESVK